MRYTDGAKESCASSVLWRSHKTSICISLQGSELHSAAQVPRHGPPFWAGPWNRCPRGNLSAPLVLLPIWAWTRDAAIKSKEDSLFCFVSFPRIMERRENSVKTCKALFHHIIPNYWILLWKISPWEGTSNFSQRNRAKRHGKLNSGELEHMTWKPILFVENLNTYHLYMCPLKLSQHRNPTQVPTSWGFMSLNFTMGKPTCPQVALFWILFWLVLVCTVFTDCFPSSNIISYAFSFRQWESWFLF